MASITKRADGKWRARYRVPDGKERARHFNRKVDAERWAATMSVARARGEWVDPSLGRRTFESWVEEWGSTIVDLRGSTLDRDLGLVRNHLVPAFGAIPLAKITTTEVRAWVARMVADGEHSPATVRKTGQVLAKVMSAAVDEGLIARSPCVGVRLPAEPHRDMWG